MLENPIKNGRDDHGHGTQKTGIRKAGKLHADRGAEVGEIQGNPHPYGILRGMARNAAHLLREKQHDKDKCADKSEHIERKSAQVLQTNVHHKIGDAPAERHQEQHHIRLCLFTALLHHISAMNISSAISMDSLPLLISLSIA